MPEIRLHPPQVLFPPTDELPSEKVRRTFDCSNAFALMKYVSQDGVHVEWLYNGRDGVAPFGLPHRYVQQIGDQQQTALLAHMDSSLDRCLPYYIPAIGERVVVDLTDDLSRQRRVPFVARMWQSDEAAASLIEERRNLIEQHSADLLPFQVEMKAWAAHAANPQNDDSDLAQPKPPAGLEAVLNRMTAINRDLWMRDNFPDQETAVNKLVAEDLSQPGAPCTISGSQYMARDPYHQARVKFEAVHARYVRAVHTALGAGKPLPDDGEFEVAKVDFAEARKLRIHPGPLPDPARYLASECGVCGQPLLIEMPSPNTNRTDGKRIFYPDRPDTGYCAFRCRNCGQVVDEHSADCKYAAPVTLRGGATPQPGDEFQEVDGEWHLLHKLSPMMGKPLSGNHPPVRRPAVINKPSAQPAQ